MADDKGGGRKTSGGRASAAKSVGEFRYSDSIGTAFIDGLTFRSKPVQYVDLEGMAVVEGDILLGPVEEVEQQTQMRRDELAGKPVAAAVVISGSQYRWEGCVVPYQIKADLPNQKRVTDAIAHWEANTEYRFVQRTERNQAQYPDYIEFVRGSGCSSYVGKRGGRQPITLGDGCSLGNCIHEIGHAVGLWHEQSREDRDAFVTIQWANIIPSAVNNFAQHISDGDDIGPYDYGSIMHYPRNAFSANGQDTIIPTDPNAEIGQRTGLSPGDVTAVNSLCVGAKLPKEPIKEFPKEPIKEFPKEPVKELPKDKPKDFPKELQKDKPKDFPKEFPKDKPKDLPKDPPFDKPPKDLPKDPPFDKLPKEPPKDKPKDFPKDPPFDKAPKDKPKDLPKDPPFDKAPKEPPKEFPKDPPKDKPKDLPKDPPFDKAPKDKPKDLPKDPPFDKAPKEFIKDFPIDPTKSKILDPPKSWLEPPKLIYEGGGPVLPGQVRPGTVRPPSAPFVLATGADAGAYGYDYDYDYGYGYDYDAEAAAQLLETYRQLLDRYAALHAQGLLGPMDMQMWQECATEAQRLAGWGDT